MPISVKVSMGWHRGNSRNLGNAGDGNGKEKNDLLKKNNRYIQRVGWEMRQRHAQVRREYNQESEEKKQRQEDTGK